MVGAVSNRRGGSTRKVELGDEMLVLPVVHLRFDIA
jgi:hypothetical protein